MSIHSIIGGINNTIHLIRQSSNSNIPISADTDMKVDYIEKIAKNIEVKIPKPVLNSEESKTKSMNERCV